MAEFLQGHALLIGVGTYYYASWLDVPVTVTEAGRMRDILADPDLAGYPPHQITLLRDQHASRNGILQALDELAQATHPDDTVLIYYAGHGAPATDGNYSLTACDTRFTSKRVNAGTGIAEGELLDKLRQIPAQRLIFFCNACYAGRLSPHLGAGDSFTGQPLPGATAAAMLGSGAGRIIVSACREEQQAWIGKGELSLFAQALVDGLSGKGWVSNNAGYIGAFGLYEYLYETVKETAAELGHPQEPELTVLKGVGPFPLALYRGAQEHAAFDIEALPSEAAVRELSEKEIQRYLKRWGGKRTINTGGGAYTEGNVNINNGDFVGRDHVQVTGGNAYFGSTVINNPPPANPTDGVNLEALQQSYLSHVFSQAGRLSLMTIDRQESDEGSAQISLNAIYTALLTQSSQEEDPRRTLQREAGEKEPRKLSALEQLDREPHLVLLGEPGSGKSTFVSFVALCLAGEALKHPDANLALLTTPLPPEKEDQKPAPQPWRHGALLPVQIVVRDFAARGLPEPGCPATLEHLWKFLREELAPLLLDGWVPVIQKIFEEKGGLLLVDGLDEVFETEKRRSQIKQVLESFAAAYPCCRVLVTSRTYAYQEQNWKLDGFREAVLAPFSLPQINQFIERWYAYFVAQKRVDTRNASGNAELLKRAIAREARLLELARRPLLLTLMASLHAWRNGKLPDRRQELYEETVDLLLNRWEGRRVLKDAGGKLVDVIPSLSEWLKLNDRKAVRALLEKLAYQAHSAQTQLSDTADVPEDELLLGLLRLKNDTAISQSKLKAFLTDRAGLLLARGEGVFTFPHRTIQEYLAACHLTNYGYPGEVARLACQDPLRWREVALLAGAKAGAGASFALWALADALSPESVPDPCAPPRQWGALIAGSLLQENADCAAVEEHNRPRLERIKQRLIHTLQGSDLPALERAKAGDVLACLGDPRPEVMTVEGMRFCFIPGESFGLGLHPVSQAQFAEFVKDGGYANAQWWPEAIKDNQWSKSGFKGPFDNQPRLAPALFGAPFDLPNHPVVGVSWYESLAFTRWLEARAHHMGWLPAAWRVHLPTEPEWEKVARGGPRLPEAAAIRAIAEGPPPDGSSTQCANPSPLREYPWGGDFDLQKANTRETEIGNTSALGCFTAGAGPYGNLDLSGNVWEWQENWYDKDQDVKALRGGSWFSVQDNARCSSRLDFRPGGRGSGVGVRCALSLRS